MQSKRRMKLKKGTLKLSAAKGDIIHIGLDVKMKVTRISEGLIEVAFTAPLSVTIDRNKIRMSKIKSAAEINRKHEEAIEAARHEQEK